MNMICSSIHVFSFVDGIGTLQAVLIILGLALLAVEIFLPGFGVAGGTGILLLLVGIITTARTPFEAFIMVSILVVLVAITVALLLRSAKKGTLSKKLILWTAAKQKDGFSTSTDMSQWVGKKGVAITVLRPAGTGEFEKQRLDVVTDGSFVERGTNIVIVRTEGRRIVVEPMD
jgi:membrane-bound ClpP family serine protease